MSPWLIDAWTHCLAGIRSSTPPHAWCIVRPHGMNCEELIVCLIKRTLCLAPKDGIACHVCEACRHMEIGVHPDIVRLEPEGAAKLIKIDRIRESIDIAYKTGAIGGGRVILINSADRLNEASSNALLKIVEEPPKGTVFVFTTSILGMFLPTLLSRLRIIKIQDPSLMEWIDFGLQRNIDEENIRLGYDLLGTAMACVEAPDQFSEAKKLLNTLVAVSEGHDPQVAARRFAKANTLTICIVFTRVMESLIKRKVNIHLANLNRLNIDSASLFQLLDRAQEVRLQAQRGIAINNVLAFGSLLSVWSFVSTQREKTSQILPLT